MIQQWTLPLLTGRKVRPRMIYVYVPDQRDDNSRFPVLYMFDGHNVFFDEDATYGKSWGMKEYMEETETPTIIVAVDCDHTPPNGRLCEYSPFSFSDTHFGHVAGRGKSFMDWLTGTLKPIIDERYPTLPDRETTWIAGSSMGGLMSLYAITEYNHVFGRAAALSPSVWVARKKLPHMIRKTEFAPGTVVYMDYGSRELANHPAMLQTYCSTADALMERGVFVSSRIVPNGDHCEACWEEQIPFFMQTLLYERE